MRWSTFQRNVRDSVAPHALRPGPWEGEFQCSANTCAGNHLAAAEPIDVPRLWRRAPAPTVALPVCSSCQIGRCIPILFHSGDARSGQNPWSAQWQCYDCGIQTREVVETSADARALLLAADRLEDAHWQAAAATSTVREFWQTVREWAHQAVQNSLAAGSYSYAAAGPPHDFTEQTNSRVFVPLLLDAAHMLSAPAQAAWRGHTLAGTNWSRWLGQLQVAPRVAVTTLIAVLEAGLQA